MPRAKKTIKQEDKVAKSPKSKRHSGKPRQKTERIQNFSGGWATAVRDSGVSASWRIPRMTTRQRITDNELALDFFDTKGRVAETIDLPKEIFGAKINNQLMAQAVRVYLANQRRGTATTKARGEVSGSTKKIWQQKGTGRARHGSRKAPIFVGGGIVFGPKPRDFSLKLSKKMKRLALFSALTSKLKKGEIKGIFGFEKLAPKTKLAASAIKNLGIELKNKKLLLVTPSTKKEFENVYRGARNIEGVNILDANLLNAYEVLNNKQILLMKESLKIIEDRFLKTKEI